VTTPAGHFATKVVSNQPRTLPSFPKQNIVVNSAIRFTDLTVCKFLTEAVS